MTKGAKSKSGIGAHTLNKVPVDGTPTDNVVFPGTGSGPYVIPLPICSELLRRLGTAIYEAANDPQGDGATAQNDGNHYLYSKLSEDDLNALGDINPKHHHCKVKFVQDHYEPTDDDSKNVWNIAIPYGVNPTGIARTAELTGQGLDLPTYQLLLGFVAIMGCRF